MENDAVLAASEAQEKEEVDNQTFLFSTNFRSVKPAKLSIGPEKEGVDRRALHESI